MGKRFALLIIAAEVILLAAMLLALTAVLAFGSLTIRFRQRA